MRRHGRKCLSGRGVRIFTRVMTGLLVASASVAGAATGADRSLLRQVDLQSAGAGAATLTLTLSAPVTSHVFPLHHPERLVIDLAGTRRGATGAVSLPAGAVTGLRYGSTPNRSLRLVLDLSSPMRWQQRSLLRDGWQLRIALLEAAASGSTPGSQAPAPAAMREGPPAHPPGGAERAVVIAIDAGHGGEDPGAIGHGGTREKDVTLEIARALAQRIDREPGLRAVLTRDGDYFVALRARMQRARAAHADLFVSIHADSIRDREVSGASVYILSERGASSEAARQLAEQQNAADLKGGLSLVAQQPDLRPILLDLAQNATIGESSEAAGRVLTALDGVGAVRRHDVQQAAFVVLKSPDIPSMLVETAYISNPAEERRLRSPQQQQRLANAICAGIGTYFRRFPPENSLFARLREPAAAGQPPGSDGS